VATNRADLHLLVDRLPETEVPVAGRFLQFLSAEPIGPIFAASIRRGIADAGEGNMIVCRDREEMIERILGDPAP
jgi:hypothetical protein